VRARARVRAEGGGRGDVVVLTIPSGLSARLEPMLFVPVDISDAIGVSNYRVQVSLIQRSTRIQSTTTVS